ncbi:MAG: efflux RND transporter permease subunit [Janthinobacterium lividum]
MANPQDDDKPTKPTLIESAMRHKTVVMAVVFALMAFGVYGLFNMPRNEFPNFTIRQGLVIGVYPGASARQVEEQLTTKVEQYLFSFEEVDKTKTYSYSRDGIAYIYVEVNKTVDRNGTAEFWNKLKNGILIFQQTSLPRDVQGVIVNSDFGSTSAVLLAVESKTRPYKDLKKYVTTIENDLRQLSALSKISDSGGLPEQVSLYVDNNKLAQYGLSAGQLVQTLQQQGAVQATGELKTPALNVPVHLATYYRSETELAEQIVHTDEQGHVVRLRDVATVRREYDPDPASYVTSGGVKSYIVSLEMQPGNNIVQFGKEVDKRLTALERTFPPDIELVKLANQPEVVDESISHFMREFGIALVAVIIVTLLLLPFRIAAVAGATIPITISCTLAFMYVLGIELNTVTLAALIIVLGIVVDDPIVVIDNHVEKLDHGLSVWDAARESARELFPSVFTATLAISAVFAPLIVFMKGTARDFLGDFPVTIVLALSLSLIISMLLVPAFNTLFIKKGLHQQAQEKPGEPAADGQAEQNRPPEKKTLLDRVQNGYNWLLDKAFNHTWLTLGLTGAAVLAGLFMMGRLPQQLFPTVERNQLAIEIYLPSGYTLARTDSVVKGMERILARDKRIEQYTSFVGSSSPRFHTLYAPNTPSPNYAQILVNTTTEETTVEVLRDYAKQYSQAYPDAYVRMKQLSMGPAIPIEVRIAGDSLRDLQAVANRVQNLARRTSGVTWVRTDFEEMQPSAALRLRPNEAGRLGLSRQDVNNAVAMNLQGVQATQLWEEDYPVDVKVRTRLADRRSVRQLRDLSVASPSTHSVVPLRQVAEVHPAWEFGEIGRRNGVRTLTVRLDIGLGGLANNILAELQPKIEKIKLPPGVAISYGGELEAQQENLTPMGLSLLLSVVILFFILLFHFTSIKHALLSLMTLPLSIFGASFGLLVLGYPFGFTSFLGLLSLCGIVVRNGIILADFAGEMREHEGMSVRDAAIHAGERRMRPIFLTSAAAAVGVIPMIASGSDLWGPLGAVICFGLLFSMVLTLFALPVLYWLFFRGEDKNQAQAQSGEPVAQAA